MGVSNLVMTLALLCSVFLLSLGCDGCKREASSVPAPKRAPTLQAVRWQPHDPPAREHALGVSLSATEHALLATWIEPSADGHRVQFSRYRDAAWAAPVTVAEGQDVIANWADFPRAAQGGNGAIYVHHLKRIGDAKYAYGIELARSSNEGRSFESLGAVHRDGTPTEHGFVSMLPSAQGVRLFWLDARAKMQEGGNTALYTAEAGDTISENQALDPRICDCCQTDATQTKDGPLVVYRDRTESEVRDVSRIRSVDGSFSKPEVVYADDWEIRGCPVNGPAVAASGSEVVTAWFTGVDGGSVRVAFSDDAGQTFGAPIIVDGEQPPGRVDVKLVPGGAIVSWLGRSRETQAGEVRIRFVSPSGELGPTLAVAPTASERASGFAVMAVFEGRLFLAYRDGAEQPRIHIVSTRIDPLPRSGGGAQPREPKLAIAVGAPMPKLHVKGADRAFDLQDLADGSAPLVVTFFARWCQPCREEMAIVEQLRQSRTEWNVVAVSLDEGTQIRAEQVAAQWGFSGRVVRDDGAAARLGVPPLPALFVFGSDRKLRLGATGRPAGLDELRSTGVR